VVAGGELHHVTLLLAKISPEANSIEGARTPEDFFGNLNVRSSFL